MKTMTLLSLFCFDIVTWNGSEMWLTRWTARVW